MANRARIAKRMKRKKKCPKDRFENFFEAHKRGSQIGLRAYACHHCMGFHLTKRVLK